MNKFVPVDETVAQKATRRRVYRDKVGSYSSTNDRKALVALWLETKPNGFKFNYVSEFEAILEFARSHAPELTFSLSTVSNLLKNFHQDFHLQPGNKQCLYAIKRPGVPLPEKKFPKVFF